MLTDEIYMISEAKDISGMFSSMRNHFLNLGVNVSQDELMDTVFEFVSKNEDEMLHMLDEKRKCEIKIQDWLENPVDIEKTDALKEHDLVV